MSAPTCRSKMTTAGVQMPFQGTTGTTYATQPPPQMGARVTGPQKHTHRRQGVLLWPPGRPKDLEKQTHAHSPTSGHDRVPSCGRRVSGREPRASQPRQRPRSGPLMRATSVGPGASPVDGPDLVA